MNISFDIKIYEFLFLIFTVCGGLFALFQWRKSYKLKRAEYLENALIKIREDKDFAQVLYRIDYGEEWYTPEFIEDHNQEQLFDKVFAYFDFLCYLKHQRILRESEFRIFEYRIARMAANYSFVCYMFNLYHFSTKKNNTDISFFYLLTFLLDKGLLPEDFENMQSENYTKLLNV